MIIARKPPQKTDKKPARLRDTGAENPGVAGSIPALATVSVSAAARRRKRERVIRMANIRLEHCTTHYGAMVASKLRELRDSRDWGIDDFRNKLAEYGVYGKDGDLIPTTTAYSYEQGKDNGGANIPVDLYPVIAAIYGYRTPFGWLPSEFPDLDDE